MRYSRPERDERVGHFGGFQFFLVIHTDPVGFGALRGVQKTGVRLAEIVFIALEMKFAMTDELLMMWSPDGS